MKTRSMNTDYMLSLINVKKLTNTFRFVSFILITCNFHSNYSVFLVDFSRKSDITLI